MLLFVSIGLACAVPALVALGAFLPALIERSSSSRPDAAAPAASGPRAATPAEARAKVKHYIDHGCTCPILYPLGDVKAMIDAFAGWDGKN